MKKKTKLFAKKKNCLDRSTRPHSLCFPFLPTCTDNIVQQHRRCYGTPSPWINILCLAGNLTNLQDSVPGERSRHAANRRNRHIPEFFNIILFIVFRCLENVPPVMSGQLTTVSILYHLDKGLTHVLLKMNKSFERDCNVPSFLFWFVLTSIYFANCFVRINELLM